LDLFLINSESCVNSGMLKLNIADSNTTKMKNKAENQDEQT